MRTTPRFVGVLRWIARIWSLPIALVAVLIAVVPDQNASPGAYVSAIEWVGLAFYGLAALGLLVAWRWEIIGVIVAVLGVVGHDVCFYIAKGFRFAYGFGNLIVALFFLVPAIFFLVCWWVSNSKKPAANQTAA